MSDKEIELLEILRMMRALGNSPTDKDVAIACLVKAIAILSQRTVQAEIAIKIISAYASTFEPGTT